MRDKEKEIVIRPEGRITDEKLPLRFGNRRQRRKLESEIRKIK